MFQKMLNKVFKDRTGNKQTQIKKICDCSLGIKPEKFPNADFKDYVITQSDLEKHLSVTNMTETEWKFVCEYISMDENFMRKHKRKLNFFILSLFQSNNMSNDFMWDFKNKLSWNHICAARKFDKQTIIRFKDYIDWMSLFFNPQLTIEEVKELSVLAKEYCPYYGKATVYLEGLLIKK